MGAGECKGKGVGGEEGEEVGKGGLDYSMAHLLQSAQENPEHTCDAPSTRS